VVRGQFKLIVLFGIILIISLTAFNSSVLEQASFSSFYLIYRILLSLLTTKLKLFASVKAGV